MITINIPVEKDYFITPQQTYDIISAAIEDAYDNGFINKYVFYRAMLSHLYVTLENLDEINSAEEHMNIHTSPLEYWYEHIDGISEMLDKYQKEMSYLEETASQWIQDYIEYAYSLRGLLDNISTLVASGAEKVQQEYDNFTNSNDLKEAMKIAEEWGFNRETDSPKETKIISTESLIES